LTKTVTPTMVRYNSVNVLTRLVWRTEESWLDSREEQEIFHFARISTPDMGVHLVSNGYRSRFPWGKPAAARI